MTEMQELVERLTSGEIFTAEEVKRKAEIIRSQLRQREKEELRIYLESALLNESLEVDINAHRFSDAMLVRVDKELKVFLQLLDNLEPQMGRNRKYNAISAFFPLRNGRFVRVSDIVKMIAAYFPAQELNLHANGDIGLYFGFKEYRKIGTDLLG